MMFALDRLDQCDSRRPRYKDADGPLQPPCTPAIISRAGTVENLELAVKTAMHEWLNNKTDKTYQVTATTSSKR